MASEPLENLNRPTPLGWVRNNRGRLARFAAVGVSGVVVNLAVFSLAFYLLLAPLLSGDPLFVAANACGFVVSVFTNFLLNDHWTWGDRIKGGWRQWFRRVGRYYVTASGAGLIQLLTAWLSLFFWNPLAPPVVGIELAPLLGVLTGITCGMAINFTASHLWAFRDAAPRLED